MKEVINIRIDKDILEQIKNYQILVGKQSGFVPNRTSVIERLIVIGLEKMVDNYEVYYHTPQGADTEEEAEINMLAQEIFGFTQIWQDNEIKRIEDE